MAEKKKKGRRAYLDSFKMRSDGTYVYTGAHYRYEGDTLRPDLIFLCGAAAIMLAAAVAAGCVSAPGMQDTFYVILPYTIGLVADISVCWGTARLVKGAKGDSPLREYVYEETVMQIPGRAVFAAVCAGLACVGEVIFLIRHGAEEMTVGCILFLTAEMADFILAVLVSRRVKAMRWNRQ